MKILFGIFIISMIMTFTSCAKKAVSIFNHKDLTGWKIHGTEKWYDIEIQVSDRINQRTFFSGKFNNKNLEDILNGICFTLNCEYVITENKVLIY